MSSEENKLDAIKILPFMQAMAEGRIVEMRDRQGHWVPTDWMELEPGGEFRIRPDNAHRPFTPDEARELIGDTIIKKSSPNERYLVLKTMECGAVVVFGEKIDRHELLASWARYDGRVCGVEVEE